MSDLKLPAGLDANVEEVVTVDWLTRPGCGRFGLAQFLCKLYGPEDRTEMGADLSNGSSFVATFTVLTEYDLNQAAVEKDALLRSLATGYIPDHYIRASMLRAVIDGHLPKAKYVVSLYW